MTCLLQANSNVGSRVHQVPADTGSTDAPRPSCGRFATDIDRRCARGLRSAMRRHIKKGYAPEWIACDNEVIHAALLLEYGLGDEDAFEAFLREEAVEVNTTTARTSLWFERACSRLGRFGWTRPGRVPRACARTSGRGLRHRPAAIIRRRDGSSARGRHQLLRTLDRGSAGHVDDVGDTVSRFVTVELLGGVHRSPRRHSCAPS